MMLDKNAIEKIIRLPDDQLIMIIKSLARESGVDVSNLNIGKPQLDKIRLALSVATPDDIAKAGELLANLKTKPQ